MIDLLCNDLFLKEKSPGSLSLPSASPPLTGQVSSSPVPASGFVDVGSSLSSDFSSTRNSIISSSYCQIDISDQQTEVAEKFKPKKEYSMLLADSYKRLGMLKKADRVSDCGSFLEFRRSEVSPDSGIFENKSSLHNANFCRDRLCPMCSWRRSLKIFSQCSDIMGFIGSKYEFIFVTFTIPSMASNLLSEAFDKLMRGFHTLTRRKRFKTAVKGFYRALEITRNSDPMSKSYGLYHPHFHCVFAVDKNYFKYDCYITHSEWLQLWRDCFGDQSITQVDVRRVYPKDFAKDLAKELSCSRLSEDYSFDISSVVAEAAKYTVKSSDYIFPDDPGLTDEVVSILSSALAGRRLVSFGGCFRKAWQALQLEDPEEGDLVNLTGKINPQLRYLITRFHWSAGLYKLSEFYYLENGQPVFDKH